MRKTLLIVLGIAVSCSGAQADEKDYAKERLAQAERISDIFELAERPFVLEADLTVMLKSKEKGHVKIAWQSKDHWRREISFGPYSETVVRVGEIEYAQRNVSFQPLRAKQVVYLLEFAKKSKDFEATEEKTRTRKGIALNCIEGKVSAHGKRLETCTDSATHEILNSNAGVLGFEDGKAEFSDYVEIEGLKFPKHLELSISKGPAAFVTITDLKEQAFDSNLLTPPPGATERRYCEVMTPPVLIKRPNIADISKVGIFSKDVRVTFQVTILKDGTVGAIQTLNQSSPEDADRIRKVWKDAKYEPAMCGTEPVVADITTSLFVIVDH